MDDTQLKRAFSLWADGALDRDEMAALEAALTESPDRRQAFLRYTCVHVELCNSAAGQEHVEALIQENESSSLLSSAQGSRRGMAQWREWTWWAIAASLLLAVGFWQLIASYNSSTLNGEGTVAAAANSSSMLKSVKPSGPECTWYVEEVKRHDPTSYMSGDVLRVTKGKLALTYNHGTRVILHAPAAFQLLSDMKAKMIVGRLTANVTDEGNGFSVVTPQATVIDLGTEFGVEVGNDGSTDVVVFKGEVDVDIHDERDSPKHVQRLHMGEAVRLDAIGTRSRIVSINGLDYSDHEPDGGNRAALITLVRDNIERDSLLSYYEIVPNGLREDALAYVDRIAHEYNGITKSGMPEILLGADYVKMFNSDKRNSDFVIDVTVSAPAYLYVFLDDRLEPPQWLIDEFRDTGLDIGVDEGPYRSDRPGLHNKGPSGVGPGESVENELSIWVKEVSQPGVVRLGPAAIDDERGNSNMYGIAAVPLIEPADAP